MWSKSVELFNPYEALTVSNEHEVNKQNGAKSITFTSGTNVYDFFILPTIRYNNDGDIVFLTIEWLKWFAGVKFCR